MASSAMAVDMSGCEKLGNLAGVTDIDAASAGCFLKADCEDLTRLKCKDKTAEECQEFLNSRCGGNPETVAECIAQINAKSQKIEIYRCDKSVSETQNLVPTGIESRDGYISDDGSIIKFTSLAADQDHAYIIYKPIGSEFDLNDLNTESYYVIADSDGERVTIKKIN